MSQLPHKRSAILSWARTHRVHVADTASIQWDEADKVYVVNGVVRVPAWRVEASLAVHKDDICNKCSHCSLVAGWYSRCRANVRSRRFDQDFVLRRCADFQEADPPHQSKLPKLWKRKQAPKTIARMDPEDAERVLIVDMEYAAHDYSWRGLSARFRPDGFVALTKEETKETWSRIWRRLLRERQLIAAEQAGRH